MQLLMSVVVCAAVLVPVAESRDVGRYLAPIALSSYTTSPANIESAKVFDLRGNLVGSVKGIATDATGKPAAISVQPASERPLMVVAASAAQYDQSRNVVTTAAVAPLGIASAR